jgi:hypothetical protein
MSRGLGKLQRELLETLEGTDKAIDTITLAAIAYQAEPGAAMDRDLVTDAHHAAVRRALRSLHKRGLVVDLMRHASDGRRHWASPRVGLPVRLRYLKNRCESYAMALSYGCNTRAEAEAWKVKMETGMMEIVAIQERMKQLGM